MKLTENKLKSLINEVLKEGFQWPTEFSAQDEKIADLITGTPEDTLQGVSFAQTLGMLAGNQPPAVKPHVIYELGEEVRMKSYEYSYKISKGLYAALQHVAQRKQLEMDGRTNKIVKKAGAKPGLVISFSDPRRYSKFYEGTDYLTAVLISVYVDD